MLIPSFGMHRFTGFASLSRRVNANSQRYDTVETQHAKLIKKGEC